MNLRFTKFVWVFGMALVGSANLANGNTTELIPPTQGPKKAMITLTEFGDFHCPFCRKGTKTVQEIMKKYSGKIQWIFKHFPLSGSPGKGSFLSHEASVCAHEQGKFWEIHDAIFKFSRIPQKSNLNDMAREANIDMTKFEECVATGKYQTFLMDERDDGSERGVTATPTYFINEYVVKGARDEKYFTQIIESILNPEDVRPPPDALPVAPPPDIVEFDDLQTRPSSGNPEAPIQFVEFSDFHCPFCRKLAQTVEPLMEKYKGKIFRVFLHYPLSLHPEANRVHEASECAHDQGKFWEFHKNYFNSSKRVVGDVQIKKFAESLDLDMQAFSACYDSRKFQTIVEGDFIRGREAGVQGTPTVFINGKAVRGAQAYERYEYLIEKQLRNA